MRQPDIDRLRGEVLDRAGITLGHHEVKVLHSWELSHVERLVSASGRTAVFKCAAEPFTREHEALAAAWQAGVDVPKPFASTRSGTVSGILMEDMGDPDRAATDADGIAGAVRLHSAAVPPHLPSADSEWLASLPRRASRTLRLLNNAGRWPGCEDIAQVLLDIGQAAGSRAEGVTIPPYGWVHSEFHPESVLVRQERVRLYDFARAFRGPGLIDLASWHGTVEAPAPDRTRALLETYVEAGGSPEALARRGGSLEPQDWALGWHRVWVAEWFLAQALVWIGDAATDPAYAKAVRRHLQDAARLLDI